MRLTRIRSFLRPLRSAAAAATSYFFRRRRRSNGRSSSRSRAYPFFTSIGRKRGGGAAENPEPSSPKVTCIGQVRVKSQKKVKQCRRRINGGEASFRSAAEPSFQHQQRRDQRWVHLPSLRALGRELCCFFSCCGGCDCDCCSCKCSCFSREKIKSCGRWWCGDGGRRREIEADSGGDEAAMFSAGNSRRHVFDDIEVNGDVIEVKGRSFFDGEEGFAISIPPKNALLLMRCRSDPIKMAAIANRISSDAPRYENLAIQNDDATTSSDEAFEAQVLEQEEREMLNEDKSFICNQVKVEEIEQEFHEEEEEEEEVESNVSSFEALLETQNYQDCPIKQVEPKSEENDDNRDLAAVEGDDKKEAPAPALPENQEKAAALPECLLLMMREPKLSMEVSKETWVCATDFIKLHPERPRRAAAKAAPAGDHEPPVVKRRAAAEKSKPRVPPPPLPKKNDAQPARSSCSLPAAAGSERKRVGECEPLELTRCKSEPMSTAAAKLMPEGGCWKENVEMEPHRQASLGVGAAGVGF